MIELFKNRNLQIGDKVSIHLNLHRKDYAITALEGEYKGKVVAYAKQLVLENVTFRIRESIQKKVRKKKVKEVHAWVLGTYSDKKIKLDKIAAEAYYNPHIVDAFVDKDTHIPIETAEKMIFDHKNMYYIKER